jgi:O-antigen/teichoic acid export membrane protein
LTEEQKSYRQIFKATSLFGGVQVFNIVVTIIRSKFIAVLLGPAGMGIAGLLTSTTSLIGGLTNFGLGTSAVRDIASANETGNEYRISKVVSVFRKLVWITGTLGSVVTLILSPWLSNLTFGNNNYTIAFVWISITLLFSQLSSGQSVFLQGMRKLQYLAKANMLGSLSGLIVSVPVYYFWKIDGIVPAIILTSFLSLIIAWFFAAKIKVPRIKLSGQDLILEGKSMLRMGFMLSLSGLIMTGVSYLVRIFISNTGGVEEVGLYNAGFTIISTYVGLVFTAMGTDFYPRLSAVAQDNNKSKLLINQQAEIAILILAPILNIFLVFISWFIILLYSTKFTSATGMIHWAALGMFFKAASWPVAFILLAKGASKLYFWNELIGNVYVLGFNILGYIFWGLDGLGISFLAGYILYLIQVFLLARYKYSFSFNREFIKLFGIQLVLGLFCFILIKYLKNPWTYLTGIPIICFSTWISYNELNKRLGLKEILFGYLKR